jgi:hypothetical protein
MALQLRLDPDIQNYLNKGYIVTITVNFSLVLLHAGALILPKAVKINSFCKNNCPKVY